MARVRKRKNLALFKYSPKKTYLAVFFALIILGTVAVHYSETGQVIEPQIVFAKEDPNFHVKTLTTQFFEDNDAAEMLQVINCESHFRQFEEDGSPLQNKEGSSAIGVAQILASKHPDPKVIDRYNKKFDMDMKPDDFDITTLEGNLGYALVLYKVRGTRDWECGQKFRF